VCSKVSKESSGDLDSGLEVGVELNARTHRFTH
jgi:hypothetical protein